MGKEKSKQVPLKAKQTLKNKGNNPYINLLGLGIVILLGTIIYSNSFDCSFHFDDQHIFENSNLHSMNLGDLWREGSNRFIPYLTLSINYHFGILDVWGYHLVNLMIHLTNSILVWWLTSLILSTPALKNYAIIKHKSTIALLTALLFVSHPLATQSVTYIIQRMASLATMFYFLSLALYLFARMMKPDNKRNYLMFFGSLVSAILAMMSKENAYTIPFTIILCELILFRTKKITINLKDYRIALMILSIIGFISFVYFKYSFNILKPLPVNECSNFKTLASQNYFFTQISVLVKYLQLYLLPINQNFDYDYLLSNSFFEPRTIICFLMLLSFIILGVFLMKNHRIISFGIFWFFITMAIESSIIPISDVIVEHRTYLPSFGVFLIISSSIYYLFWDKYKNLAIAIFVIMIGSNSLLTYARNDVWKNEITLWTDATSKSPNKARPFINLGMAYESKGEPDQAITCYTKAIEINPDFDKPYNNRGHLLTNKERYDDALNDLNKAVKLNPTSHYAFLNRGCLFNNLKKHAEAMDDLNKAIVLNKDFGEAYYNRGIVEMNMHNKENACHDWQKAQSLGYQQATEFLNKYCN